jgi:hypothetical protein
MIAFFRNSLLALAGLAWMAASPGARANDSTAILKSGELQLTSSPHITMEREDLYLSTSEVRVRYRFRNTSNSDVVTLVAFPLPEIVIGDDAQYSVDAGDPANFIGFKVQVNGQGITPELQLRATRFGIDQSALLNRLGVPILPFGEDFYTKLEKISGPTRKELEEAGLVDWNTSFGANNVPLPNPHWRASAVYYWKQTFPAGAVTEVSHSYRPVPGVSFYSPELLKDRTMQSAYCMDKGFQKAARRKLAKTQNAFIRELHYVLTTGANWLGTIGTFHLTIDKGKPSNLVSLCINGIKKTSPTTFEVTKKDFIPERDLKILILEPVR